MNLTPEIQEVLALLVVALVVATMLWRRIRGQRRRRNRDREATIHFHRRR